MNSPSIPGNEPVANETGSASPAGTDNSKRLLELERVIGAGQRSSFLHVGTALAEIRDSELYKPSFPTFESYCVSKWGFKHAHAYRLIEAACVAKEVSPIGEITRESHARALAKVPTEKRQEIFKKAAELAKSEGRNLTADHILEVANLQPAEVSSHDSDSIEDQLRALWEKATPEEQTNFLGWVNAQSPDEAQPEEGTEKQEATQEPGNTDEAEDQFRCKSCGDTFATDDEAVTLYACGACGTRFTRETSANDNHQCPDCNKYGSKESDLGCPNCNESELVKVEKEEV